MGSKKKMSLKQTERMQARKSEKKEPKSSDSPPKREKKTAGIILPNLRSEKITNEIKKMKTLTPFAVASRFNIRLSVARDLLKQLEQKGIIQFVSRSRNLKIYTPVDWENQLFEAAHLAFPKRVYTEEEVQRAKEIIEKGYKHQLAVNGSPAFKKKLNEALRLIKLVGYYDFLRTYIRQIEEINGFSQLHEADVAIWATMHMLEDPVDAASYVVQKAQQMKDYVEGKLYYGVGEMASIEKRIEFLEKLKKRSKNTEMKKRCEELLQRWADSTFMFP